MSIKSVVVVDDEEKIREVIVSYLQREGYRTLESSTGTDALEIVRGGYADLVILDLMLPDLSGEDVCKAIRQMSAIPIIMLTAKVAEDDRVRGLNLGADDYVVKPFSPRELMARVKANMRRSQDDTLLADVISFGQGELVMRTSILEVSKDGTALNLTPNEYKLLVTLARHPGRIFSRDDLIVKALGFDFDGDARTIDQHIKNIRQKIETDPKKPKYIITVYGVGYRFASGEG